MWPLEKRQNENVMVFKDMKRDLKRGFINFNVNQRNSFEPQGTTHTMMTK